MAHGVTVLGAKSWPESVDIGERARVVLNCELSGDSHESRLSEEVLGVIDLLLVHAGNGHFGDVVILRNVRRYLEHFTGSLAIGNRQNRSVDIQETHFLEKLVGGHGECVADARHRADNV